MEKQIDQSYIVEAVEQLYKLHRELKAFVEENTIPPSYISGAIEFLSLFIRRSARGQKEQNIVIFRDGRLLVNGKRIESKVLSEELLFIREQPYFYQLKAEEGDMDIPSSSWTEDDWKAYIKRQGIEDDLDEDIDWQAVIKEFKGSTLVKPEVIEADEDIYKKYPALRWSQDRFASFTPSLLQIVIDTLWKCPGLFRHFSAKIVSDDEAKLIPLDQSERIEDLRERWTTL